MMRCLFFIFGTSLLCASSFEYHVDNVDEYTAVHILLIDPSKCKIISQRAGGRETVQSIAERAGAKAAINGGFWRSNGAPMGVLKSQGIWQSLSWKYRGAIGWNQDLSTVSIDRIWAEQQEGEFIVNPQHEENHVWQSYSNIVGGVPVLIRDGKVVSDYSLENITIPSFITKKHCRTAVGLLEDGRWIIVVASGPIKYKSGFTLKELTNYMQCLGCTDALNLDGGRSSTIVIDGEMVNLNRETQKVSDAILIFVED